MRDNMPRYIRKELLGLSQAELARLLDTRQATISRFESVGRYSGEWLYKVRDLCIELVPGFTDSMLFERPERDSVS